MKRQVSWSKESMVVRESALGFSHGGSALKLPPSDEGADVERDADEGNFCGWCRDVEMLWLPS